MAVSKGIGYVNTDPPVALVRNLYQSRQDLQNAFGPNASDATLMTWAKSVTAQGIDDSRLQQWKGFFNDVNGSEPNGVAWSTGYNQPTTSYVPVSTPTSSGFDLTSILDYTVLGIPVKWLGVGVLGVMVVGSLGKHHR